MRFYSKHGNGDCPLTSRLHLSWSEGRGVTMEDPSAMAPGLRLCAGYVAG